MGDISSLASARLMFHRSDGNTGSVALLGLRRVFSPLLGRGPFAPSDSPQSLRNARWFAFRSRCRLPLQPIPRTVESTAFPMSSAASTLAHRSILVRLAALCLIVSAFGRSASAQVVVLPHGDQGVGPQKYIVAAVALVLLCIAVWQHYGRRR